MKTKIDNDWAKHTWPMKVEDREYSVTAYVLVTIKGVRDEYHSFGRDEYIDYSLEGWDSLPLCNNAKHIKEIERQLLGRLEEEYGMN